MNMECECQKCGNPLDADASVDRKGTIMLKVEPCETCVDNARDEGITEGHREGYEEGHSYGKSDGYDEGYEVGLEEGKAEPGGNGP